MENKIVYKKTYCKTFGEIKAGDVFQYYLSEPKSTFMKVSPFNAKGQGVMLYNSIRLHDGAFAFFEDEGVVLTYHVDVVVSQK